MPGQHETDTREHHWIGLAVCSFVYAASIDGAIATFHDHRWVAFSAALFLLIVSGMIVAGTAETLFRLPVTIGCTVLAVVALGATAYGIRTSATFLFPFLE